MQRKRNVVTVMAVALILAAVTVGAKEKSQDVPPGFDRPLVIDRHLERKVTALEKQVAELKQAVDALKQEVKELRAAGQP